jgi:hypothetical protein
VSTAFLSYPVSANGGSGGSNGGTPGLGGTMGTYNGGDGAPGHAGDHGGAGGGSAGTGSNGNPGNEAIGAPAVTGGGPGGNGRTGGYGIGFAPVSGPGGGGGGCRYGDADVYGGNGADGQVVITYTCPMYNLTSTIATTACASAGTSTVTLASSAENLPAGMYTVTYNTTSPNQIDLTASMTVTTPGSGNFIATGFTSTGSSTLTITRLASGGGSSSTQCYSSITSNNTATVVMQEYILSGTLKYNNPAKTPMKNVTLTLSPGGVTSTTDNDGNYSFGGLCDNTYTIAVTNNNKPIGSINSTDAAQANSWSVNPGLFVPPIEKVRFSSGDVYGNGVNVNYQVTPTDAQHIQSQYVYGDGDFDRAAWSYWIAGKPINNNDDPDISGNAITETISGANKTLNLLAEVTGDFNGSYVPGSAKTSSSTLYLTYGSDKLIPAGTACELPVRIVDYTSLGAASVLLNFPPDLMEISGVTMKDNYGQLDWKVIGDELRIGWNSLLPLSFEAGEALVIIRMKTTAAFVEGHSIRVSLANDPLNELADGYYNVIPDVVLNVDVIEAASIGTPELSGSAGLTLEANPNPFYDYTVFNFRLPSAGHVTLEIDDIMGHRVSLLLDDSQSAGEFSLKVDAISLQPGIYIATLRLECAKGDFVRKVKMVRAW